MVSSGRTIVNYEMERASWEAVVAYFKAVSWHLPRVSEETNENLSRISKARNPKPGSPDLRRSLRTDCKEAVSSHVFKIRG